MRLKRSEITIIKQAFSDVFTKGSLYLFGSRVDDNKRGGDIDLYIIPFDTENLTSKKIDVVIDRGTNRLIDIIAKEKGILLCQN